MINTALDAPILDQVSDEGMQFLLLSVTTQLNVNE